MNLAEFDTTINGNYPVAPVTDTGYSYEFGITVSGMEAGVCSRIMDMDWRDPIDITGDTACGNEENALTFIFADDFGVMSDNIDDRADCNPSSVCGTLCCAEGTYCSQGADTSTYICAEPTGDCASNSDCTSDQYCKFTGGDCNGPTGGTCTDKGSLTSYTLNLPAGDLTVYKGLVNRNWWSASNLCKAHKKQMVTMSDLGISDNGQDYCYFDNAKRVEYGNDETYQCNCVGDSGCITTAAELYKMGSILDTFWFADNSSNSCTARCIYFAAGNISYDYRSGNQYGYNSFILCR